MAVEKKLPPSVGWSLFGLGVVVVGLCFVPGLETSFLGQHYRVVIATVGSWLEIAVGLGVACWLLGDTSQEAVSYGLIVALGGLLGWALGMYFSPYGTTEHAAFVTLGQAVSAFASGYLVSKIDRLLERVLFREEQVLVKGWQGAAMFAVALLATALTIYTCRAYLGAPTPLDSARQSALRS